MNNEQFGSNLPKLTKKMEDTRNLIQKQILKGEDLLNSVQKDFFRSIEFVDLEEEKLKYKKWDSYNEVLLKMLFSTAEICDRYKNSLFTSAIFITGDQIINRQHDIERYLHNLKKKISELDSIKDSLELYPSSCQNNIENDMCSLDNRKVFIVHGHDNAALLEVERFLKMIGLSPIILHNVANNGKTIIEKLELYSDVGYSVVILSPDDEGKAKGETDYKARARQNVIAELGYFFAKLGRSRVCALYNDGVEIPTDFSGVLYVLRDDHGAWKLKLFRELEAVNYKLDKSYLSDW